MTRRSDPRARAVKLLPAPIRMTIAQRPANDQADHTARDCRHDDVAIVIAVIAMSIAGRRQIVVTIVLDPVAIVPIVRIALACAPAALVAGISVLPAIVAPALLAPAAIAAPIPAIIVTIPSIRAAI